MSRRVKYCWIVEVHTPRGWEPCYESQVNCAADWADENRQDLEKKHPSCTYRVAKYIQVKP